MQARHACLGLFFWSQGISNNIWEADVLRGQLLNSIMSISCDICKREFTEKRSLTRHVKNQHGNLWSCHRCNQSFNRWDNYEMHQRICLSGDHLGTTAKKLKDNTSRVGSALNSTVNEYHLNLEDEQQDASNVLDVLKESTFQMENRISRKLRRRGL